MAAGIIPAVGLATSVFGQVSSLGQASRSAKAQEEAQAINIYDAEQRAQLSLDRYLAVRESAKLLRDRELETIAAQRRLADLSVSQQELMNTASQIQTQQQQQALAAQGEATSLAYQQQGEQQRQQTEGETFAQEQGAFNNVQGKGNELIGQLNAGTQQGEAAAQANQQVGQVLQQVPNAPIDSNSGEAVQQQQINQAVGAFQQVGLANRNARGISDFNINMTKQNLQLAQQQLELTKRYGLGYNQLAATQADILNRLGQNQQSLTGLQSQSIGLQQQTQDQLVQSSSTSQRKQNAIQSQRNRKATQAAYQQSLATGTTQALAQVMQERANIAQSLLQMQQTRAQAPTFGDYAAPIVGGIVGGYNLYQQMSQQRGVSSTVPQYGLTQNAAVSNLSRTPQALGARTGIQQALFQQQNRSYPGDLTQYNYGRGIF